MMGRWKRDGNYSPPKNKLVQDSEGNEENKYPDLDSNKTKINYTKETNEAHKNTLKEEILQVIKKRDVTRHDQPKHTRGTQEILRQQK
jgi:hypothetical protein